MKKIVLSLIAFPVCQTLIGQAFNAEKERSSLNYSGRRAQVIQKFKNVKAGNFGEFIPGIMTRMVTSKKIVALTFDACGGPRGSEFDTALIAFLKKEKIPATLFVAGSWIEKNTSLFKLLCEETLFEIENHGLSHRPCSLTGKRKYGIAGTQNSGEVFDEIELNARQIEFYSKRKPQFYRPAAAAADEGCVSMAKELEEKVVNFDVLSGDAVQGTGAGQIAKNIIDNTGPGSIIIMHMNQPKRKGFEALEQVVPELRKQGYEFVKLEGHPLVGKK